MIRAESFRAVGGYDATLIAGEDPELCLRIRRSGGRIVRLDRAMTRHDADLQDFAQWWRRQVRSGHAYAESVVHHWDDPDPRRLRRLASVLIYAAVVPAVSLLTALPTSGWSLLGLVAFGIPWAGAYRAGRRRAGPGDAAFYATGCLIGKFAELEGALRLAWNRLARGRRSALIEYKGPESRARNGTPQPRSLEGESDRAESR